MPSSYVILADLKSRRCSSTVEVRLLRFWEARSVKHSGDLMGVDMLFLDSKVIPYFKFMYIFVMNTPLRLDSWLNLDVYYATLMPATVNFHRLTTYKNLLKDGYMYSLSGFDITRCNQNCRLSGSLLLIRFSDSTRLDELTEQVIPIPDFLTRHAVTDGNGLQQGSVGLAGSTIYGPTRKKDFAGRNRHEK
ncbi:hypothetical protein HID58_048367 [Brassica napus]|uniref:Uncharacterized protein n=1 Tax=Brassica napus TaxID=3708 RepID=A0ABQ8B1X8_BRANA|nr:hypothetical protein HID58_048367 [Brassica napus]